MKKLTPREILREVIDRESSQHYDLVSCKELLDKRMGETLPWFTETLNALRARSSSAPDRPEEQTLRPFVEIPLSSVLLGQIGKAQANATGEDRSLDQARAIPPLEHHATSHDGLLLAKARQHLGGVIEIRVETREESLKNGFALVEFRTAKNETIVKERVDLKFERSGVFYGLWMSDLTLADDVTMYVAAFPSSQK